MLSRMNWLLLDSVLAIQGATGCKGTRCDSVAITPPLHNLQDLSHPGVRNASPPIQFEVITMAVRPLSDNFVLGGADSILGAHLGTTDYLLNPIESKKSSLPSCRYHRNQDAWRDIIAQHISAGMDVVLERFQVMDWFPRAPGLYCAPGAEWAREEAFHYLHHGFPESPIRDHARDGGHKRVAGDAS